MEQSLKSFYHYLLGHHHPHLRQLHRQLHHQQRPQWLIRQNTFAPRTRLCLRQSVLMVQLPVAIVLLKTKTMDVTREGKGAGGILLVQGVIILLLLPRVLLLILGVVQFVHQPAKLAVRLALMEETHQDVDVLREEIQRRFL